MTPSRADELLQAIRGKRLLVVGDVCIDHYIDGVVERLNTEAPVPLMRVTGEHSTSGAAGNVAKNTVALGVKTILLSVIGEDEAAKTLRELVATEGYEMRVTSDSTRHTIRKVRHLVGSQQLLRVDYEETHDISAEKEKELLAAVEGELSSGVDAIIVSDYAKGVITQRVGRTLVAMAQNKQLLLAADLKPSRAPFFVGAGLLSPNRKEGYEFLGLDPLEATLSPGEVAKQLQEKMGGEVYLTLGGDGMHVVDGKGTDVHVPQAHRVEVFDVSGAGDTAIVVLTLARLVGATPLEAAELANAAGAVVVGKIGSATVLPEEILAMLSHQHRDA